MRKLFSSILILILIVSCSNNQIKLSGKLSAIQLTGDLKERTLESSSLSWYNDNLIILPQFPHKWDSQFDGALFFIPKSKIESYLKGVDRTPIQGEKIQFVAKGLDDIGKSKGSGYEAITFVEDTVFVSIESINKAKSTSYVVRGVIDFDNKKVILDATTKHEVKSQTDIYNMGEETIFSYKMHIYTIHEANGINVNKRPYITQLTTNLKDEKKIKFQNVDYRITDATKVDSTGKFFVMNYYYPGEYGKLKPQLSKEKKEFAVEKIIELQVLEDSIIRTIKAPLIISEQKSKSGYNWEGIVKFKDGFLIMTDMFPQTTLAYVKDEQ